MICRKGTITRALQSRNDFYLAEILLISLSCSFIKLHSSFISSVVMSLSHLYFSGSSKNLQAMQAFNLIDRDESFSAICSSFSIVLVKSLKGYKIFRSENEYGTYSEIATVTSKNRLGIDTSFIDQTCTLDRTYYYFIKAFDELNQVGEPSDTVYYKLM